MQAAGEATLLLVRSVAGSADNHEPTGGNRRNLLVAPWAAPTPPLLLGPPCGYAPHVTYIITLPRGELGRIESNLRITQRLTKALSAAARPSDRSSNLALIVSYTYSSQTDASKFDDQTEPHLNLTWIGVILRANTVGPVDKSITIDPLRECTPHVPLDGPKGLLQDIPDPHRRIFEVAMHPGTVGHCDAEAWEAFLIALRAKRPTLIPLLDWLLAQANTPYLSSHLVQDRSWQEQQDAARTILRLADFPLSALAAWQRPSSPDSPYLAGLIPEPVEHSLIDHDVRALSATREVFGSWRDNNSLRCDIHVMQDREGRRLEMANVNATPVETRLGTDMIYYHEPTRSFVLVQYKRLDSRRESVLVDKRLLSQIEKLETVADINSVPKMPHDWRLGTDACFLKLAHWPEHDQPSQGLAPGMYLPISYVRLLLADDSTRGRGNSRILGYENIERYLVNTQFIELVKHGLAGTVGVSIEQLKNFGRERVDDGYSVIVAAERSRETIRERQRRANRRGPKKSK